MRRGGDEHRFDAEKAQSGKASYCGRYGGTADRRLGARRRPPGESNSPDSAGARSQNEDSPADRLFID